MNKTKIEYLDYTFNPIAMRCDPVSAGCKNCWHLRMAKRLANNPTIGKWEREAYAGKTGPVLIKHRLDDPLKVKKPLRIGVQFMGDLFHEDISYYKINRIFNKMINTPWHTFVLLTKRPENALKFYRIYERCPANLWLGVTVEHSDYLYRIEELLQIPAAVRFVSVEPCLDYVDLAVTTYWDDPISGISWVVIGAEGGPKKRYFNPKWAERIILQCEEANIPVFYKQDSNQKMPMVNGKKYDQFPGSINKTSA